MKAATKQLAQEMKTAYGLLVAVEGQYAKHVAEQDELFDALHARRETYERAQQAFVRAFNEGDA